MRRRRLVIFAFHLRRLGGHHLTEVQGYRRAADAQGIDVTTYAPMDCDPALAAMVSAKRMIPGAAYPPGNRDELLDVLPSAPASLDPIWEDILREDLCAGDILYFTHGNPIALFDLTRRLAALPEGGRPAVFVTFLGAEFREPDTGKVAQAAIIQRFVAGLLAGVPGQERVFYTVTNHRQAGTLSRICGRRVFVMPMPEDYGFPDQRPPPKANRRFTVYFHVTEHGAMETLAVTTAERLLAAGHDVDFVFKLCRHGVEQTGVPETRLPTGRVRMIVGEEPFKDYLAAIGGADMVVLPYPRQRYQVISSGSFCEAAGFGAVIVAPRDTWPGDRIADGSASGVLFDETSVELIARAADEALRRRNELVPLAAARAAPFRLVESCAAALARMLELAAAPPNMRADSVVGDDIDFTTPLGSRHLLASGWSATEQGLGVWSNDDRAGLSFTLADLPSSPLIIEVTGRPFLAPGHEELAVRVSAGGMPIADWHFGGRGYGPLNAEVKRRATISAALATARPLKIDLAFDRPASPAELGMSADPRRLGLLLRSLRFLPEGAA